MRTERSKGNTGRFPGILQVRQRKDAEAFYLSKATTKTICGLFVRTTIPLDKGSQILTAVNLPRLPDPIFIDCEVVWVKSDNEGKPAGMAVKFLNIAERDRRILDKYFRTSPIARSSATEPAPHIKQLAAQRPASAQTKQA